MATTSLLYQKDPRKFKDSLRKNMELYASKSLSVGPKIYESESKTNSVNLSLAYLLKSVNRFYAPVVPSVDAYTYQCSIKVTADNLARMASVFANKGVNPTDNKRMLSEKETAYILNNLLPEGLYEYSDDWIARTGGRAYAKSGVGGGILIVLPGVCGIGIISPPLDSHGNSVKGIAAGVKLAKFLSRPVFGNISCTKRRHATRKKRATTRKRKNTRTKYI
jgi:glutaminase